MLQFKDIHVLLFNFPIWSWVSFPEVIEVRAEVQQDGDGWRATGAGFDRTARRVIRVEVKLEHPKLQELYKVGMLKGTRTLGEIQFLSLFYFTGSASWNSREMPVQGVKWIVACRPDQCPGIWCAAMYLFHAQREHHDMPWAILQCTKMGDLMATKMDQSFHVISVCWWIALSLSCIVPIWWAVPCLELF